MSKHQLIMPENTKLNLYEFCIKNSYLIAINEFEEWCSKYFESDKYKNKFGSFPIKLIYQSKEEWYKLYAEFKVKQIQVKEWNQVKFVGKDSDFNNNEMIYWNK